MSENFKSSFDEYILSRIQNGAERHRKGSPSYRRMREKYENFYELAEEIIDELPHDAREIMIDLFDMGFTIQMEGDIIIYNQGMRDCVSILKYLGAL